MNYLSHLFFSQRTPLSYTGNLMGDFKREQDIHNDLPKVVLLGIKNHRLVDRATDRHPDVKSLRPLFSKQRRRFSGVITDIAFDYFLIKHWQRFTDVEFDEFIDSCYDGLSECLDLMPSRMQYIVENIVEHDWLRSYQTLEGVGKSIDLVSKRIRFDNNMAGGVSEVEQLYPQIEGVFLPLFEHLQEQVTLNQIETQY